MDELERHNRILQSKAVKFFVKKDEQFKKQAEFVLDFVSVLEGYMIKDAKKDAKTVIESRRKSIIFLDHLA